MTLEEALAEIETLKAKATADAATIAASAKSAKGGKAASDELAALRAENETLKATAAEVATKGAMVAIGITDPDDQEIVLFKFGKVAADEEGNKPALDAWLSGERKAKSSWLTKLAPPPAKATTAKAAKVAEPVVVAEAAPAVAPAVAPVVAAAPVAPAAPARSPDGAAARTVIPATPRVGQFTEAQIRDMPLAQYRKVRDQVKSELAGGAS